MTDTTTVLTITDDKAYETLLPLFESIHPTEIRNVDMPVNEAVSEGEKMAELFIHDAGIFAKAGLDKEYADTLKQAAGALRVAEGKWVARWGERKESRKEWEEKEPLGYELRDDILAALSFALRNDTRAMRVVRNIRDGGSDRDMIQDLRDCAELAKMNIEEMGKINISPEQIQQCSSMADELGTLYVKAYIDKGSGKSLDIRNRAFTHMRSIMSEILDAARYVHRKNPQRLEQYYSDYRQRKYRSNGEKTAVAAIVTE